MVYVKEQNSIKKYNVEVDKEKLNELRNKIILNCSYLTHFERKLREDDVPNEDDYLTYRNLKKQFIGIVETRDFFSSGWENLYKVAYDMATFPEVIKLIDEVMNDKYNNILVLINYKEPKVKHEKQKTNINISSIEEARNAKDKIDEIINTFYNQKLNENRVSVNNYMNEVKSCIKLILVDELDFESYNIVYKFFDGNLDSNVK